MSGKPKLTTEQQSEVVECYKKGESVESLAQKWKLSRSTVLTCIFRAGVEIRKKVGGLPQTPTHIEQQIVDHYVNKTMGTFKICATYGINKGTVYNILNRRGYGTRAPGANNPKKEPYIPKNPKILDTDLRIAAMFKSGKNYEEVGREVGLSGVGVVHSLRKQGLYIPRHARGSELVVRTKPRIYKHKEKRYSINQEMFNVLTPDAMYYLGFLITDGCIHKQIMRPSYRLHIRIAKQDVALLEDFKKWVGSNHKISTAWADNFDSGELKEYAVFQATANEMCERLIQLHVTPAKTKTASAPPEVISDPDFWRGCLDGDGCIYQRGDGTAYLSGTKTLIEQFEVYCQTLVPGLELRKHHHISHCGKFGCWVGAIRHVREAAVILKTIYQRSGPCLQRKRVLAATHWL